MLFKKPLTVWILFTATFLHFKKMLQGDKGIALLWFLLSLRIVVIGIVMSLDPLVKFTIMQ